MGLFDFIADIFGQGKTRKPEIITYAPLPTQRRYQQSAIPRGRMRVAYEIEDLPSEPGIYRHIDKETKKVIYIGQTNNLRRRNQEHIRDGNLDLNNYKIGYNICKPNVTRDDWCDTEKKHIKKHRPSRNKYRGGNGRR